MHLDCTEEEFVLFFSHSAVMKMTLWLHVSVITWPAIQCLHIVATTLQSNMICCNSSETLQSLKITHCVLLKCRDLLMLLHNATSQKTEFMIVIMLLRCGENSMCCVNCHLGIIHEFKIVGE
jgi:hypothetical protein